MDDAEEGRHVIDDELRTTKRSGQIEAEAVHVHLRDPVAEAVHDELQRPRVAGIGGVAAAGEVHVVTWVFGAEVVVIPVIDAFPGEGGAEVIAFGGVVIDNVENDLDPCMVEGANHRLEFMQAATGIGRRKISRVGSEETEAVVAPVVDLFAVHEEALIDVVVDGQQLNCRDAQVGEVFDGGFAGEAGVGAANGLGHVGHEPGKAFDVGLVNDCLFPGNSRDIGVVALIEGEVFVFVPDGVAEEAVVPLQIAANRFGVGIEYDFVGIEPVARFWLVWPMNAQAVELPRLKVGKVAVPDLIGAFGEGNALSFFFGVG
jgi:hypothetical protein